MENSILWKMWGVLIALLIFGVVIAQPATAGGLSLDPQLDLELDPEIKPGLDLEIRPSINPRLNLELRDFAHQHARECMLRREQIEQGVPGGPREVRLLRCLPVAEKKVKEENASKN